MKYSLVHTIFAFLSVVAFFAGIAWSQAPPLPRSEYLFIGTVLLLRIKLFIDMRNGLRDVEVSGSRLPFGAVLLPIVTWILWIPALWSAADIRICSALIAVILFPNARSITVAVMNGSLWTRLWPFVSLLEPVQFLGFLVLATKDLEWNPSGLLVSNFTIPIIWILLILVIVDFLCTALLEQQHRAAS